MVSIKRQILHRVMSAVCNYDGLISAGPAINPEAVRCIEFSLPLTRTAKARYPVGILVITMNEEGAVSIRQQESTIIQEREIGRHEPVLPPNLFRFRVFTRGIHTGLHGSVLLPNRF